MKIKNWLTKNTILNMFDRNNLFLVTFMICLGSFCVNAGMTPEERAVMWKDIRPHIIKCAEKDLTMQQIAEMRKNDPDTFFCRYECFLKSIGVFDDNNVFKPEKMAELVKMYIKNPDVASKFENNLKDCSEVNDKEIKEGDGKCAKAKMLLQCFMARKEDGLLGMGQ